MSNIINHEDRPKRMLRKISSSTGIDFKCNVPYRLGEVGFSRIGFADIPVVGCRVSTKDISDVIPIVRQHIMRACAERGLDVGALDLMVTTGHERRKRKVVDENDASPSFGKNKILNVWRCHLEILRAGSVAAFKEALPRVYL